MTQDIDPQLDLFVQAALAKKAEAPVFLDIRRFTSVAEAFLIVSGRSNRQVSAIAEHIKTDLKKHGIQPLGMEGAKEGHWVLIDYGHVVIHVFYDPVRSFYDLEGLWSDAPRIQTPAMEAYVKQLAPTETDDDG
ncbi:MAG: ribosome silencing factor [Desulfobacterales bacterium]|nr:ribosome silencing factor [Desulfobacterales bacterium]